MIEARGGELKSCWKRSELYRKILNDKKKFTEKKNMNEIKSLKNILNKFLYFH
jgi:hypothetical protein